MKNWKIVCAGGALAFGVCSAAFASDVEMMAVSSEIAGLLASEEICGLSYDQAAISAFISERVDPEWVGFASQLDMVAKGASMMFQDQTESARTAHCAAITRTARAFGFIE